MSSNAASPSHKRPLPGGAAQPINAKKVKKLLSKSTKNANGITSFSDVDALLKAIGSQRSAAASVANSAAIALPLPQITHPSQGFSDSLSPPRSSAGYTEWKSVSGSDLRDILLGLLLYRSEQFHSPSSASASSSSTPLPSLSPPCLIDYRRPPSVPSSLLRVRNPACLAGLCVVEVNIDTSAGASDPSPEESYVSGRMNHFVSQFVMQLLRAKGAASKASQAAATSSSSFSSVNAATSAHAPPHVVAMKVSLFESNSPSVKSISESVLLVDRRSKLLLANAGRDDGKGGRESKAKPKSTDYESAKVGSGSGSGSSADAPTTASSSAATAQPSTPPPLAQSLSSASPLSLLSTASATVSYCPAATALLETVQSTLALSPASLFACAYPVLRSWLSSSPPPSLPPLPPHLPPAYYQPSIESLIANLDFAIPCNSLSSCKSEQAPVDEAPAPRRRSRSQDDPEGFALSDSDKDEQGDDDVIVTFDKSPSPVLEVWACTQPCVLPEPSGSCTPSTSTSPVVFALDCEMVKTERGLELARATLLRFDGYPCGVDGHPCNLCRLRGISCSSASTGVASAPPPPVALPFNYSVVFDTLVVPPYPVLDYLTRFSGITPSALQSCSTTLADVQRLFLSHVRSSDVVVGHSLENDFRACRFLHKTVVDTSTLFPGENGRRRKLKDLCKDLLGREIQTVHAGKSDASISSVEQPSGHDSVEDALASMDLALRRGLLGPTFGQWKGGSSTTPPPRVTVVSLLSTAGPFASAMASASQAASSANASSPFSGSQKRQRDDACSDDEGDDGYDENLAAASPATYKGYGYTPGGSRRMKLLGDKSWLDLVAGGAGADGEGGVSGSVDLIPSSDANKIAKALSGSGGEAGPMLTWGSMNVTSQGKEEAVAKLIEEVMGVGSGEMPGAGVTRKHTPIVFIFQSGAKKAKELEMKKRMSMKHGSLMSGMWGGIDGDRKLEEARAEAKEGIALFVSYSN